jgi:formate hydrogenlyase transcriptional activator
MPISVAVSQQKEKSMPDNTGSAVRAVPTNPVTMWLRENGPRELEALFRAVVYHRAAPILVADNDRNCHEASTGAGRLLGVARDKIIGRRVDDFAEPGFKPELPALWREFVAKGDQEGTLWLDSPDGSGRAVEYQARTSVLPDKHVLSLSSKPTVTQIKGGGSTDPDQIPKCAQDYALFLLDEGGYVVTWYSGASRMYGSTEVEAVGRQASFLYPEKPAGLQEELRRATAAGRFGDEYWQIRKDGSRFWANVITLPLKDVNGKLQGFARMVRDFSDRHEKDEKLRRDRAGTLSVPAALSIAGVISGEFDRIPEANDALLALVGYTREDLMNGTMQWHDLTPPAYSALDEFAHEEALRFGACTPFEKELIRKDGTRIAVRVTTAVLKLSPFHWITFVQDLRERNRLESVEHHEQEPKADFGEMVGRSLPLRAAQRLIEVVAPTDATVLILGETGTGKELVARAIHRVSGRRKLPFVTLNCAAIPTGLLESELFGYEKGAFTGALSLKIGRFEMAHRGTLFLDEVGDIPLELQPKLLRALQEKSFERLGGTRTIPIDVRLIAATNRNLTQMMGDKLFRSDLYYRLKVFPITTSPLRDHPDDIPLLTRHFVRKYSLRMGRHIEKIPSETMRALVDWPWPGNVRELENFIERSVILSSGTSLRAPLAEICPDQRGTANDTTLEEMERTHILQVLRSSGGVITRAATRLGMHRTTLNATIKKLGISRSDI